MFPHAQSRVWFVGLLIYLFCASAHGVSLSVSSPAEGALVGDSLFIRVSVASTYEVLRVHARIEAISTSLTYSTATGDWTNTVSLADFPAGPKILTITATDVFGSSNSTTRTFIKDRPPRLFVHAPSQGTVARPSIFVKASAEDDANGVVVSVYLSENMSRFRPSLRATNTLEGAVTCNSFTTILWFEARDAAGQSVWAAKEIVVDGSTNISHLTSANGPLLDATSEAVLYYNTPDATNWLSFPDFLPFRDSTVTVESREQTNAASVPVPRDQLLVFGAVPTTGQALIGHKFNVPGSYMGVAHWNERETTELGYTFGGGFMAFGRYAAWAWIGASPPPIILRDLVINRNVLTNQGVLRALAPNGDLIYALSNRLYRSRIAQDGGRFETLLAYDDFVITDGTNDVFVRSTNGTAQTILLTPSGEEVLPTTLRSGFLLNAGWLAYSRLGSSGQTQIWARAPSGEHVQRTFFSGSSSLESLNSDGQLTFTNATALPPGRYLSVPNVPQPLWINVGTGRPKWINGVLHLLIGRSIFVPSNGRWELALAQQRPQVALQGLPGLGYTLQTSSNLLQWADRFAFTNTSGTFLWSDDDPTPERRFYRAVPLR